MRVNLKELGFDVVKSNCVAFGALDQFPNCNHENLENVKIQYVAYDSDEHSIVLKVKCCKCHSELNIFGISFREMSNLIVQKLNLADFISQRVMAKAFEEGQDGMNKSEKRLYDESCEQFWSMRIAALLTGQICYELGKQDNQELETISNCPYANSLRAVTQQE